MKSGPLQTYKAWILYDYIGSSLKIDVGPYHSLQEHSESS